jgi:hypothetical protein
MKNFIPFILLVFVLIFSCQKKDDPTPANITTAGATTGSTAGTTSGAGVTFNGLCSNQRVYSIISGQTYSVSNTENTAVFTNTTMNNFSTAPAPYLNAGTVSLNNKIFRNMYNFYSDSTNTPMLGPFNWSCTGGTVAAFTATNSNSYVTYSDYVYWPDTIKKSENFTISLTGSHNSDEVQVLISKSGTTTATSYTALATAGYINISSGSLAPLSVFTTAVIQCNFYKNNIQNINGRLINFRNVTSFIKTVPVKN